MSMQQNIWEDIVHMYNTYLYLDTSESQFVQNNSFLKNIFARWMIPTDEDILVDTILKLVEIYRSPSVENLTEEQVLFINERPKTINFLLQYLDPSSEWYLRVPDSEINKNVPYNKINKQMVDRYRYIHAYYHHPIAYQHTGCYQYPKHIRKLGQFFLYPESPEFKEIFFLSEYNPREASNKAWMEYYNTSKASNKVVVRSNNTI
jgi:hypothetical protein